MTRENSRIQRCYGKEVRILLPKDPNWKGSLKERVERAVRYLWSRGIYPSPTAVNMRLRGEFRSRANLNSIETTTRNRMLKELGIGRQKMHGHQDADYLGFAKMQAEINMLRGKLKVSEEQVHELEQERKNACT